MIVISYHGDMAEQVAIIAGKGRKYFSLLLIESSGIVCRKVPLTEEKHFRPLLYRSSDYPLKRAVNKYLSTATRLGASKSARKALNALKAELSVEEMM